MKTVNHEQAQRWLQARLDGMLSQAQSQALDAHLQTCPTCRRYAVQIEKLDANLRHHFQVNAEDRLAVVDHTKITTVHSISDQVRVNMFAKRIWNFVGSSTLMLGLVALMAVLITLTVRSYSPALPVEVTPPIATSSPTPAPGPITDTGKIVAVLETLAEQNARLLHQPGWVRTQWFDDAEPSGDPVHYTDSWKHYPKSDGVCVEGFTITRTKMDSSENLGFSVWSGGVSVDLVELRNGQGKITTASPADMQCVGEAQNTPSGELAARLMGKVTAFSQGTVMDLDNAVAWYETVGERPVLLVKAKFHNDQSQPPVQIEQYTFDLQTGLLTRQNISVQKVDGTPLMESRWHLQTDIFLTLPAETSLIFQQAVSELTDYQSKNVNQPTPVAGILDRLPSGPDAAAPARVITNVDTIVSILQALRERQVQWLSRPGWYLNDNPSSVTGDRPDLNRHTLIHMLDQQSCELMTFYRKGDQVLPEEIRLPDGRAGEIATVENGIFTTSKTNSPCTLDTLETIRQFDVNIAEFPKQAQTQRAQFRAWVGQAAGNQLLEAGRAVLVIVVDATFSDPKPEVLDPDTGKLEAVDHRIVWYLYDLQTGTPLVTDRQQFLNNTKVIGKEPNWTRLLDIPAGLYTYSPQIPAELAPVFKKAVEGLNSFLGRTTP